MKKKRLQRSDKFWLGGVSLLILLQFWWLPGNPGTPDDTYSNALAGKRGFFQTLEDLSTGGLLPPVRRETEMLIPWEPSTLIIVSPDRYPNVIEEHDLATFVRQGNTLVFAPAWNAPNCSLSSLLIDISEQSDDDFTTSQVTVTATPAPAKTQEQPSEGEEVSEGSKTESPPPSESSSDTATSPADEVEQRLRDQTTLPAEIVGGHDESLSDGVDIRVTSDLMNSSVRWRTRAALFAHRGTSKVLVEGPDGSVQAATWPLGLGHVVVAASPDVFSNSSMLLPDQAELAVRLVAYADAHHGSRADDAYGVGSSGDSPSIVVSEYLNTSDKYRGTAVLVDPSLRSGTLQLLLVAVLAGWFGFHRFGPIQQQHHDRRRSLTESAAAVGNLHFRTHNGAEAVQCYLAYMTAQLRRHFGVHVDLRNPSAIAARAGLDTDDVADAIDHAEALVSRHETSTQVAGKAIRRLAHILDQAVSGQSS